MQSVLSCPSCGAAVPVRSAALPYVTCGYCQTLIRRMGDNIEAIGKVAVLPFDVSPFQLGSTVGWRGTRFTLIGRVRWGWQDGSWNEWFAEGADGAHRWLGEAMGSFLISEERAELLDLPQIRAFAAGEPPNRAMTVTVGDSWFEASDVKEASCLGSEGDLPFATAIGTTITSVDFRSPDGAALSLQRGAGSVSAWLGEYLELGQLVPANLRTIEGWAIPAEMR
ncbi:DUF4178 domain-containing protein [Sphingopyxis fribergensis]